MLRRPIPAVREGVSESGFRHLGAKPLAIGWLTITAIAWGAVRSTLNNSGLDGGGVYLVPVGVSVGFLLLLAAPLFICFDSPKKQIWLLGASVTITLMPSVPLMPYVREAAHLVLLVLALKGLSSIASFRIVASNSFPLRLYVAFLGVCALSVGIGQLFGSAGYWELKVGIAELIVLSGIAIGLLAMVRTGPERAFALLLDGFAWAAIAQMAIMPLAIYLAITTDLMPGNDTLHGLGYWDRVKSIFSNPDQAGVFFAASIPIMILWAQRSAGRWPQVTAAIYLQLAPWFIMASGSRTARLAMIVAVGACLLNGASRSRVMRALPSLLLASYVGFMYQSFPSAVEAFAGHIGGALEGMSGFLSSHGMPMATLLERASNVLTAFSERSALDLTGMNLNGRFFEDARWQMIAKAWDYYASAPFLHQLLGFGAGIGGYRLAIYPSAHSSMDLLIEIGLVGFALLAGSFTVLIYRLTKIARDADSNDTRSASAALILVALIAATMGCVTYKAHTWGFVIAIYCMALLLTPDKGRWPELTSDCPSESGKPPVVP